MKKITRETKGIYVAIFAYLAYSCVYLCRLNLSVASVDLKSGNIMTEGELGLLSSLFLVAYALGKLFLGRVGDKLPPKTMIVSGLALSALTNLLFGIIITDVTALFMGFIRPTHLIFLFWFVNGVAQSLIWGPVLRIVSSKFDAERRAAVMSILATCVGVGSILGVVVASFGISAFNDLRAGFFIPAGISFVTVILFIFFIHDTPRKEATKLPPMPFFELIRDRAFIRMISPALLHGVIKDNVNVWMGLFFANTFGLDLKSLSYYVFIIPVCTLAGRILFLPVLKLCRNNENTVAALSLGACSLFAILLALGTLPLWASLICYGGIACAISMTNTTILSIFPARYLERGSVSSVASYMDVVTYGGAALGSLAFGFIVDSFGYAPIFIVWAVCAFISGIFMVHEAKIK